MINKLYFNLDHITKKDKKWIFSEIEKEKSSIGYYSLPSENISNIIEFEKSISNEI